MYFKNDKHKALFKSAIKKMDKKDNVQMCIVYLLTAERKLWNKCRIYMIDNKNSYPSGKGRQMHGRRVCIILLCKGSGARYNAPYGKRFVGS